jgi:succinate dehydrogenase/fumarate reductase flavoprotein subunit
MAEQWDRECDVLIIGFGGAGASAAIEAHDLGADVLIVEKSAAGGGNTRVSGGSMRAYRGRDAAIDYIDAVSEGTTPRDVIAAFVDEADRTEAWMTGLGATVVASTSSKAAGFPRLFSGSPFAGLPGADSVAERTAVDGPPGVGAGKRLWAVLERSVKQRGISVLTETPALELLTDADGAVDGALVQHEGSERRIRARRATVLASGGYQSDHGIQAQYLGETYYGLGPTSNSGDGIRMAQAVGADLWHMAAVACTPGYRVPDFEPPIGHHMPAAGFVYLDQHGNRFMDETGIDAHGWWAEATYADPETMERPRIPAYVVFGERTRLAGPIAFTDRGAISDLYAWSADNSEELRRGWIRCASSREELAEHLGVEGATLEVTLTAYDASCAVGRDDEFGRDPATLEAIGAPPYYSIQLWPTLFNTQGGPRRDASCRVINALGRPIPRLFSAGELGSLWHRFYPGAGNVSEALASGRIAGRNAAADAGAEG